MWEPLVHCGEHVKVCSNLAATFHCCLISAWLLSAYHLLTAVSSSSPTLDTAAATTTALLMIGFSPGVCMRLCRRAPSSGAWSTCLGRCFSLHVFLLLLLLLLMLRITANRMPMQIFCCHRVPVAVVAEVCWQCYDSAQGLRRATLSP